MSRPGLIGSTAASAVHSATLPTRSQAPSGELPTVTEQGSPVGAQRGALPLRLGGQTGAGPRREGLGLGEVDAHHGPVVEPQRVGQPGPGERAPLRAHVEHQARPVVRVGLGARPVGDARGVVGVAYLAGRDLERRHLDPLGLGETTPAARHLHPRRRLEGDPGEPLRLLRGIGVWERDVGEARVLRRGVQDVHVRRQRRVGDDGVRPGRVRPRVEGRRGRVRRGGPTVVAGQRQGHQDPGSQTSSGVAPAR